MDRRNFLQAGAAWSFGGGNLPLQEDPDASVRTVAELQSTPVSQGRVVYAEGRSTPGDGGDGFFVWNEDRARKGLDGGTGRAQNALWVESDRSGAGHWFRIAPGNRLNVRWFGAKGDGTADDAPAINDAVYVAGYLGVKTTFIPAGTYRVDAPIVLTWTSGQRLKGQNAESTRLVRTGSETYALRRGEGGMGIHAAVVVPTAKSGDGEFVDSFNITIDGLELFQSEEPLVAQQQSSVRERYGVFLEASYRCRLENLKINGFHTAVYGAKVWLSRLSQIHSKRCVNFIHMVGVGERSFAGAGTSLEITNCYCGGEVLGDGYRLSNVVYSSIQNSAADKVEGWPYRIRKSRGISLIGCGFEKSQNGRGILFEGAVGVVSGCKSVYPYANTKLDGCASALALRDLGPRGSDVTVMGSHFGDVVSSPGAVLASDQVDESRNAPLQVDRRSSATIIGSRLPKNIPAPSLDGTVTRINAMEAEGPDGPTTDSFPTDLKTVTGSGADEVVNQNFRRLADAVQELARTLQDRR